MDNSIEVKYKYKDNLPHKKLGILIFYDMTNTSSFYLSKITCFHYCFGVIIDRMVYVYLHCSWFGVPICRPKLSGTHVVVLVLSGLHCIVQK